MSLISLAFPYEATPDIDMSINQIEWISEGSPTLSISVGDSIKKVNSTSQADLLNFVENKSNNKEECPFLLKIDDNVNKLALHLHISTANQANATKSRSQDDNTSANLENHNHTEPDPDTEQDFNLETFKAEKNEKFLVLVKSLEDLDLSVYPVTSLSACSIFDYSSLSLNSAGNLIIEDSIPRSLFIGDKVTFSIWETDKDQENGIGLMKFTVWLAKTSVIEPPLPIVKPKTTERSARNSRSRPSPNHKQGNVFNFSIEDGPLFRSTLSEYENKLPIFKNHMNDLYTDLKSLEKTLNSLIDFKFKFMQDFEKVLKSHFQNNMLFETFAEMDDLNISEIFLDSFNNIFDSFEKKIRYFLGNIVSSTLADNLCKYNNNISVQKKQFETNSKEYYSWLNKYLSSTKDKDLKLFNKKKQFELAKYDYLNYLLMIIHNPHITLFFNNILIFVQMENRDLDLQCFRDFLQNLDSFSKEKAQFKKQIEASSDNDELTKILEMNSTLSCVSSSNNSKCDNAENGVNGVTGSSKENYKAGILFTLGGQGKQGWHKHWIVLNEGVLIQYADWRKGQSRIGSPVEIALSSIKPTTHDKRRFCFEIITSGGDKHVFQAVNDKERDQWMKALYNAGQQINVKKKSKGPSNNHHNSNNKGSKSPHHTGASNETKIIEEDHMKKVQSLDKSNLLCVDCGSADAVEWISLNFLVVFCLKCSSCHRNLGSHITKIRSLKLDNFIDEAESLLNYINNKRANSYLEENLPEGSKLIEQCTDGERLTFISNKYLHKEYCSHIEKKNEELVKSVQNSDIVSALKFISCGANIDTTVHINGEGADLTVTLFEYSLKKHTRDSGKILFVISELLVLNGANIGTDSQGKLELHDAAKAYWSAKVSKLYGVPTEGDVIQGSPTGSNGSTSLPRSHSSRLIDNFKKKKSV